MCCTFLGNAENGQLARICNPSIDINFGKGESAKMIEPQQTTEEVGSALIVLALDGCHTLLGCSGISNLIDLPIILNDKGPWFDQYGQVDVQESPKDGMILLKHQILCGTPPADPPFLMAAFRNVKISSAIDNQNGLINIIIEGDLTSRVVIAEFWQNAIVAGSCSNLGKTASVCVQNDQHIVSFACVSSRSTIPPNYFLKTLAIQAFRSMCDDFSRHFAEAAQFAKVIIKWDGNVIWDGELDHDTSIAILSAILQMGLWPCLNGKPVRLINKGRKLPPDTQLKSISETKHRQAILLHAVPELTGGGPSKQQQRSIQQSAVASVLLDHGYELSWVSKTVEILVNKFGLPKIQSITSLPMGSAKLRALTALCEEASIVIPKPSAPTSQAKISAAPWNNSKKRRGDTPIDPCDFTLVKGFFLNQDSTPCEQRSSLRAQCNGVILVTPEQAAPWIQEGRKLSADELGMIVLGKIGISKAFATTRW